jgi:hypothetical protein
MVRIHLQDHTNYRQNDKQSMQMIEDIDLIHSRLGGRGSILVIVSSCERLNDAQIQRFIDVLRTKPLSVVFKLSVHLKRL